MIDHRVVTIVPDSPSSTKLGRGGSDGSEPVGLVPAGYAEKAMASLMQLHGELMDEKERRLDLLRCVMEKDQALAELRMYVELLEQKLEARPGNVGRDGSPATRSSSAKSSDEGWRAW